MTFQRSRTFIMGLLCLGLTGQSMYSKTAIRAICIGIPELFKRDDMNIAGDIGYWTGIKNIFRASTTQKRLFDILSDVFGTYQGPSLAYDPGEGMLLPAVMQDWLLGNITGSALVQQAQKLFATYGGFESSSEKDFMQQVVRCTYTPTILAKIFAPLSERVESVQRIKTRHQGVLLGLTCNFDKETFQLLRQKHSFLGLFDQHFISGQMGTLTQLPAFWEQVLQGLRKFKGDIVPQEILVVTSEQHTAHLCRQLGFQVLLVKAYKADGLFGKNAVKKLFA